MPTRKVASAAAERNSCASHCFLYRSPSVSSEHVCKHRLHESPKVRFGLILDLFAVIFNPQAPDLQRRLSPLMMAQPHKG